MFRKNCGRGFILEDLSKWKFFNCFEIKKKQHPILDVQCEVDKTYLYVQIVTHLNQFM